MLKTKIAVLNESSIVTDVEGAALTAALQIQITRDFAPVWGIDADLAYVPKGGHPAPGRQWLVLLDTSDQASALGYHDCTSQDNPMGKIFCKTTKEDGGHWTVTASHELLEMLGDPETNLASVAYTNDNKTEIRAYENCFTGDTEIPLLDGVSAPISGLVGRDEFWVYSMNAESKLRPGRGHSARLTRKDAPVVKVTLDDGSSFRCTPDHRVMTRDGSYCEAKDLAEGQSLMPFYRRLEPVENTKTPYEQVFEPASAEWRFTHRFVEPKCPRGYVRHHVDFNRFNNRPSNLILMTWADHQQLHADHVVEATRASRERMLKDGTHPFLQPQSAEHREQSRQQLIRYNKSEKHRRMAGLTGREVFKRLWQDDEFRAFKAAQGAENMRRYNDSPEQEAALKAFYATPAGEVAKRVSGDRCLAFNGSPEHLAAIKRFQESPAGEVARKRLAEIGKAHSKSEKFIKAREAFRASPEGKAAALAGGRAAAHKRWHVGRGITKPDCELCAVNNHRVASVVPDGTADVYDFTVEKYHNFALEAGVFVHNCDAVEDDPLGYQINGILLSDFVTKAWFDPAAPKGTKFDFKGHCTAPLQLLKGGYIGILTAGEGWTQQTADRAEHHTATARYAGNRWHRRARLRGHGTGRASTAHPIRITASSADAIRDHLQESDIPFERIELLPSGDVNVISLPAK